MSHRRATIVVAAMLAVMIAGPAPAQGLHPGTAREKQVACTGTTALVAPSNGSRVAVTIQNQSATSVFLCYAATCTTTTAPIVLGQNSGLIEETYYGPLSCITSGGSATVGVVER